MKAQSPLIKGELSCSISIQTKNKLLVALHKVVGNRVIGYPVGEVLAFLYSIFSFSTLDGNENLDRFEAQKILVNSLSPDELNTVAEFAGISISKKDIDIMVQRALTGDIEAKIAETNKFLYPKIFK
jgi:hypothetical protein